MAAVYKNFIYNEDRGFIFGYVPKVACTNWKSLLRYMAGHEDWLDNKMAHDKVNGGLRYLDLQGSDVDRLADPSIMKLTMVRDPYSRALSGYLNKVEKRLPVSPIEDGEDHFIKVTRDIDEYRKSILGEDRYPETSFEVFLLWLRDSGSWFTNDEHWAPQVTLLRQPEVKFDIIGRFENIENDAPRMLAAMECDQPFPTQKDVKFAPTNANEKLNRYYTEGLRELVQTIYADDFATFGYSKSKV